MPTNNEVQFKAFRKKVYKCNFFTPPSQEILQVEIYIYNNYTKCTCNGRCGGGGHSPIVSHCSCLENEEKTKEESKKKGHMPKIVTKDMGNRCRQVGGPRMWKMGMVGGGGVMRIGMAI